MQNDVLKDIAVYALKKLQAAYGFCGAANDPDLLTLNSTDNQGKEITIVIKLENGD